MPEKLLSDKIEEFIEWLEEATEFGEWSQKVKDEVQMKLIDFMTSTEEKK